MPLIVESLTFNPFEENTLIITDTVQKECIIIDPGCFDQPERDELETFLAKAGTKPVRLINTHCHIDHILGNAFISRTYGLDLEIHQDELPVLNAGKAVAGMYGIPYELSPQPASFLEEGDRIAFGGKEIEVIFAPGHSPASICLYCKEDGWLIGGDVLFYESIGRTDLPGGDHETLLSSIRKKLWPLPGETIVYPGHGPQTTIAHEKLFNPFLR